MLTILVITIFQNGAVHIFIPEIFTTNFNSHQLFQMTKFMFEGKGGNLSSKNSATTWTGNTLTKFCLLTLNQPTSLICSPFQK